MTVRILSIVGLVLGMVGAYLTVKRVIVDTYQTKESFSMWPANEKLFNFSDKAIRRLGRSLLSAETGSSSEQESHVKTLREGNEAIWGFLLLYCGFLAQLCSIVVSLWCIL